MHWTALLAYRRVPPAARVIGDIGCIHCGYNLRGLKAGGSCPECGHRVGDSLFILAKPLVVAGALRGFANSYLTFTALALILLNATVAWPLLVAASMFTAGALYRTWCAVDLRMRGELKNSNLLFTRAHWLAVITALELVAAAAWLAALIVVAKSPTLPAAVSDPLLRFTTSAWVVMAFAVPIAASLFGNALTDLVGTRWTEIELKVQRWIIVAAFLLVLFTIVFFTLGISSLWLYLTGLLTFMVLLCAWVLTWVAIHHVANTAESAQDSLEEFLDTQLHASSRPQGEFHDPRPPVPIG